MTDERAFEDDDEDDGEVDAGLDEGVHDPWHFLPDIGAAGHHVKESMLPEFAEHSETARALLAARTFIEETETAPPRERSDRPDTWTGQLFVLNTVDPVKIAPRDGLRTSLLIVSLSNAAVPQGDGSSLAPSNGWVTVSPRPMPRNGYGPGPGRNTIPPGGTRSYDASAECWAIASAAGTVVEVTMEKHDRGVNNDSTSMDAE